MSEGKNNTRVDISIDDVVDDLYDLKQRYGRDGWEYPNECEVYEHFSYNPMRSITVLYVEVNSDEETRGVVQWKVEDEHGEASADCFSTESGRDVTLDLRKEMVLLRRKVYARGEIEFFENHTDMPEGSSLPAIDPEGNYNIF